MSAFLEEALTASASLHGVLMDVFGVGILLLGKSGIGKSEIALDLVMRGHRLVADDIVDVTKRQAGHRASASGTRIIKHHMEIRGLGIINIKDLFGVAAVRDRKKIELVIELVEWDPEQEYDRLGVEERNFSVLDVDIPCWSCRCARAQHDDPHRGGRAQPPAEAAGPPLGARVPGAAQPGHRRRGHGAPAAAGSWGTSSDANPRPGAS